MIILQIFENIWIYYKMLPRKMNGNMKKWIYMLCVWLEDLFKYLALGDNERALLVKTCANPAAPVQLLGSMWWEGRTHCDKLSSNLNMCTHKNK